MTQTRPMTLGGRTFEVPSLPLKTTIQIYPVCRKLSLPGGMLERSIAGGGSLDVTPDELTDVAAVALACAQAADPTLTADAFDALPITPPELLDAFFVARYQTGAWIAPKAQQPGEAPGAESPPQ